MRRIKFDSVGELASKYKINFTLTHKKHSSGQWYYEVSLPDTGFEGQFKDLGTAIEEVLDEINLSYPTLNK